MNLIWPNVLIAHSVGPAAERPEARDIYKSLLCRKKNERSANGWLTV